MADPSTKLKPGIKQVLVPDIGNFEDVNVIEVLVKAGDTVKAEDGLITLETDKAAMDVPAPFAGVIKEIKVKAGDRVSQGSLILLLESGAAVVAPAAAISGVAPQILKNNDEAASSVGAGRAPGKLYLVAVALRLFDLSPPPT